MIGPMTSTLVRNPRVLDPGPAEFDRHDGTPGHVARPAEMRYRMPTYVSDVAAIRCLSEEYADWVHRNVGVTLRFARMALDLEGVVS
jgi:hypothetical protein